MVNGLRPDEVAAHRVDVALDRLLAVGPGEALSPAVKAVVGLDLGEHAGLASGRR